MTDYNLSDVSPRPWKIETKDVPVRPRERPPVGFDTTVYEQIECVVDANGKDLGLGAIFGEQPTDVRHAIHCVNLVHDLRRLCEKVWETRPGPQKPMDVGLIYCARAIYDALNGDSAPLKALAGEEETCSICGRLKQDGICPKHRE